MSTIDDHRERLQDLGHELGIPVVVGARPKGARPLGDAPLGAQLCRGRDGTLLVHAETIETVGDVEATLHELAHGVVGLDVEWPCFEREAVWALRFGSAVAAEVARVAWKSGGYQP